MFIKLLLGGMATHPGVSCDHIVAIVNFSNTVKSFVVTIYPTF